MDMEEKGSSRKRIDNLWSRLEEIEKEGLQVEKLKKSLSSIDRVSDSAPAEDLDRALSKIEGLFERIEKKKGEVKKNETSDDGVDSNNGEESSGSEKDADNESDHSAGEEGNNDINKGEGKEFREDEPYREEENSEEIIPDEETPKIEEEPAKAEMEQDQTESEPQGETGRDITTENTEEDTEGGKPPSAAEEQELPVQDETADGSADETADLVKKIKDLEGEAESLGGDTTAIKPHIKAMEDSLESGDRSLFDQYHDISEDWLKKYLLSLYPAANNDLIAYIREQESQYLDLGKMDRIDEDIPDIPGILKVQNSGQLEVLRESYNKLTGSIERIKEDLSTLSLDLDTEIREKVPAIREKIERIQDGSVKQELQKGLDDSVEMIKEDIFGAYGKMKETESKAMERIASKERDRFQKMIGSIEPIINRIGELSGEDSSEFIDLVKKKDQLVNMFSSDLDQAMEEMGKLLDDAAIKAAELEEDATTELEEEISRIGEELGKIEELVDTSPVQNIISKANEALEDGDLNRSRILLEKSEVALDRIKARGAEERAKMSLDEIIKRRDEMAGIAVNTAPLDEHIEKAREALKNREMNVFDDAMDQLREKLELMEREELRVEYQKLLIRITNEINSMKESGIDVSEMEKRVEKAKELNLERELRSSVSLEREILSDIRDARLSSVVEKRIDSVKDTLEEAKGLLVDTDEPSRNVEKADELIKNNMVEDALDILVQTQVNLEQRMTSRTFSLIENEIMEIWKELKKYDPEVEDVRSSIQESYNLADDGRFKEAMEHLYGLRESLEERLTAEKAVHLTEELSTLIKRGRSMGLKIASFKASQTKARVLIDAGDLKAGTELLERQIMNLGERINNRRELQDKMDTVRGRLIGLETKISRLVDMGRSVKDFRDRMKQINEYIEVSEVEKAEEGISSLNTDMDRILKSEETTDEVKDTEGMAPGETIEEIDPATAKSKLFELVGEIRKEMKERSSRGMETGRIKKDIEEIQNLVIGKDYLSAYNAARECLNRLKG